MLSNPLLTYLARTGFSAAVVLILLGVIAGVNTALNYKLMNTLNCYGFGEEYYEAFLRKRLNANPNKLQNIAECAEILMKMGNPIKAIDYLESANVPQNSTGVELAMRLYVYVISALKTGDVELAEREWGKWQGFISSAPDKPNYQLVSFLLNYSEICIDCCAGRFGKAYQQLTVYMKSREYRKYHPDTLDCEILMLWILNAMGWTEQFNELLPQVGAKVEMLSRSRFSPMFDSQAVTMREDFNKAINGIMPL